MGKKIARHENKSRTLNQKFTSSSYQPLPQKSAAGTAALIVTR
jgi:hypothetical protein